MPTIKQKIDAMRETMGQEGDNGTTGIKLQKKAVKAILGGKGSAAWGAYMAQFADTPEQLARLLGEDAAFENPGVQQSLAYIVADAVCGTVTRANFGTRVNGELIDAGLPQDGV